MGRALGNSQAEQSDTSTTEIKPPMANATGSHLVAAAQVRVKRWGKSPPRTGQPERYGKPHPEQCRIGASRGLVRKRIPPQGRFSPEARVGSLSAAVTPGREEWSSKGATPEQNPAYRPSARLASKVVLLLPEERLRRGI